MTSNQLISKLNPSSGSDLCLIGLDLGTTAIKGVLTDGQGRVLATAGAENCLLRPAPDRFELDPEAHYQRVCSVIRELLVAAPCEVVAVALAAASGNTLLTGHQGRPLTNIISWMDRRAETSYPASLSGLTVEEVREVVGWPCTMTFPLAHLAWLQENCPELYGQAEHFGMDTDWLVYRLTGQWRLDHSTATTFHLQDQLTGSYYRPFLRRLNISSRKLSKLVPSGTAIGRLTEAGLVDTGLSPRVIMVAGSFDHPAAARAVGVMSAGQLMLSCGTSWVGFMPVEQRSEVIKAELLCDPFLAGQTGGPWGGIFSVPYIGQTIDWYIDNLIAPGVADRRRVFDQLASQAEPGSGGLRIDLTKPPVKIKADRSRLSRAVMEGAAHLLQEKIAALQARGFRYRQAVMVGGPANSPVWPTIIEQVTGLELSVGNRLAGACGAAILAGIGAGVYQDEQDFSERLTGV